MNQVSLVGRITKNPVLRELSEGRMQTSFILAVNRTYKNSKGEIEADFVPCSLWGRVAEVAVKHCGKGSLIGVTGRIQSRSYEKEDRTRVYVTEVIAEDVRFLLLKGREEEKQSQPKTAIEDSFHLPNNERQELPIG